jgi:PKD repeat protein
MKGLLGFIRRRPRLTAGAAMVLLLALIVPFALRSAGPAHAQTRSAASTRALVAGIAPNRRSTSFIRASAGTATGLAGATSAATAGAAKRSRSHARRRGPGVPATPPTSHALSQVLHQATGLSPSQVTARQLCPAVATGTARCAGEALVLRSNNTFVHPRITDRGSVRRTAPALAHAAPAGNGPSSTASEPQAYTPAYLQQAYDLAYDSQTGGTGDTVAIVDAYNDTSAASDLSTYRSFYGLPACTTSNGCFREVNENGGTSLPSTSDPGWNQEISLDLDTVSAICPNCHIVLVEATSSNSTDMIKAEREAGAVGAKQISDSWTITSGSVPSGTYTFSGVSTVAATGDDGYVGPGEDNYPAALPGVTAAGGTSLSPASGAPSARGFSEGAWAYGGSGCDLNESKPAYQSDTGCTGRSYADLSADADPNTGLAVYDNGDWLLIGGTSLATPMVASYYAITGVTTSSASWAYGDSGNLNDVVTGNDGTCASNITYICNAGTGYDGPTGVGSISGDVVTGAPGIGGPAIVTGQNTANTYTQSVAEHTASVTGGIYRNGRDTKWWIQYWTSGGSVQDTPATDIGSGTTPVSITGSLSGLSANTAYTYQLVAQNSLGTTYGYDYNFTTSVAPAGSPTAAFTVSPTTPAPNSAVTFDASGSTPGSGSSLTYIWNFGDGQTETTASPTTTHTYTARGPETVSLQVNNGSLTDSTTQTVMVDTPPTPAYTAAAPVTSPNAVGFDGGSSAASAGGTITDYTWNFGDGTTEDTGASPTASHAYANAGVYTATLTVTDDLNVSSTVSETVVAGAFTASPTGPTPSSQVTFTAGGSLTGLTGTPTDYSWNFGDGSAADDTGTTTSDQHTYTDSGDYTVALTITTSTNQTAVADETITVDSPPTAAFTPSTTITTPDASVSFNGSASAAAGGGSIDSYTWNFGDGSPPVTQSSPSASHVYSAPGTYTAMLTVTDSLGVSSSSAATQQVVVDQPAAAFAAQSTTLAPGGVAYFNAGGSSDPESTITDYSWNFGDGSPADDTGTTPTASHPYGGRGHYTVLLTITNGYGQQATTTRSVTVDMAPSAAFTPSPSLGTAGSAIAFNSGASAAMAGGSITDYAWNFGDGWTEDAGPTATVTHAYASPGTYTVTLIATDDLGLTATTSEQVTIQAASTSTTPTQGSSPPFHAPVATKFSASLAGAKKQKLASALAHGVRVSLTVSKGAKASFQVTIPVLESKLAGHRPKNSSIVLLRTQGQALGAGLHSLTLKLSRSAANELAGAGPLVLTVKVTLTEPNGTKVTRSVKITLAR